MLPGDKTRRITVKSNRTAVLVAAILLFITVIAGCAAVPQNASAVKDTLVVANQTDPETLAPFFDTVYDRDRITSTIYETLMLLKQDGTYEPVLATSWEWRDDTHLVFHLRENVKFHNGSDFTAEDVLFSVKTALESPTKDIYSVIDLANCATEGNYTFVLALTRPDSVILSRFGSTAYLSMLDKDTCEAAPDKMSTNPIGTGPYKFVSWIMGDSVTVERFGGYWGDAPKIRKIVYRKVAEASQRVIELQTGGVDFAYGIPASSAELINNDESLQLLNRSGLLVTSIYFNATEGKPLANADVRRAIAYAIDFDALLAGAAQNSGGIPKSFASSAAAYADAIAIDGVWAEHDVQKAKELMAGAGYENGLALEICLNADNAFHVAAVEMIANQLKEIGITLNIKPSSLGPLISYLVDTNNPWDMSLFNNGEASALLQASRFDKDQCPFLTPHTDDMQAICDRLWACTDETKAASILKELNLYVQDNMIIIPLYEAASIDAASAKLTGFEPNAMSYRLEKMYYGQ